MSPGLLGCPLSLIPSVSISIHQLTQSASYRSPERTSGKFFSIILGSDIASRTPTWLSRTPRYYVGPRNNISDLELYIGVRDIISGSKIIMSDPGIIMFLCAYLGVRGTTSDPEIPLDIISGSDIVPRVRDNHDGAEIIEKIFPPFLRGFCSIIFTFNIKRKLYYKTIYKFS